MNDKSKTEKTAFGISKEEFQQMLEEQERSKPLEDKALERFVKKPEESNYIIREFYLIIFSSFCNVYCFSCKYYKKYSYCYFIYDRYYYTYKRCKKE